METETATTQSENDLADARIMIVDDVPKNIQVLGSALRNAGYNIIPASSGEQALLSAERHHPELILLDVMMPDMNGYETLERLRSIPATNHTPVIFATGLSEQTDEEKGLQLGAVDYITKPINIPIMLARVATHLRLARARIKLEEQNQELIKASELREDVDRITKHDLKNPLTVILGAPQVLIGRGDLSEGQIELLQMIKRSGYTMLEMINSSLDLYRMETGAYVFNPAQIDAIQVFNRIHEEFKVVLTRQNLNWCFKKDGVPVGSHESAHVQAEELLCYSMFANLIKNAIEASRDGETITISIESGSPVRVRIHNPGVVPTEVREQFFSKYATHGKRNGTGLGTYSARLIVETLGGSIAMDTSEDKGTTITVKLQSINLEPSEEVLRAAVVQPNLAL
jgi:CheY-like chemotaxis protein